MYRLFIDEFGHDNLNTRDDPKEQFLSLTGVVLNGRSHSDLNVRMNALKMSAFGSSEMSLHRREVIDKKPPFHSLKDPQVEQEFSRGLLCLIQEADYNVITVLIDKKEHFDRYRVWRFQPYHYCLTAMMERYVMLLDDRDGKGDVMAEWRGVKPNMKLERAYTYIFNNGTDNMPRTRFQRRLTTRQLKIETKHANIAGLQLADLLANPCGRDLICQKQGSPMTAVFGTKIVKVLYESKYHRNHRGMVKGCGTKSLP